MNRLIVLVPLALACADAPSADAPSPWQADAPLAAPPGRVELTIGGISPGGEARVTVTGVTGDEEVNFVLSVHEDGRAVCPGRLPECLDLAGPVVHLGRADERGEDWASLAFDVPRGAAIGTPVWIQAVVESEEDGWYVGPSGETRVDWLACPDIWAPVCGVNGRTYGNECEAAAVGWPIAYEGEC